MKLRHVRPIEVKDGIAPAHFRISERITHAKSLVWPWNNFHQHAKAKNKIRCLIQFTFICRTLFNTHVVFKQVYRKWICVYVTSLSKTFTFVQDFFNAFNFYLFIHSSVVLRQLLWICLIPSSTAMQKNTKKIWLIKQKPFFMFIGNQWAVQSQ